MTLTDAQKQQVARWIQEGIKLSELQNRLAAEFGLKLTYMEVRFLMDDLKLVPKDPVSTKPPEPAPAPALPAAGMPPSAAIPAPEKKAAAPDAAPTAGKVSVSVDTLTRPGSLVSGKVTFSDGQKSDWYLDQMGRLGLKPASAGYRPSAADVQEFQLALESMLSKMGM
jgi:hypothetical protein